MRQRSSCRGGLVARALARKSRTSRPPPARQGRGSSARSKPPRPLPPPTRARSQGATTRHRRGTRRRTTAAWTSCTCPLPAAPLPHRRRRRSVCCARPRARADPRARDSTSARSAFILTRATPGHPLFEFRKPRRVTQRYHVDAFSQKKLSAQPTDQFNSIQLNSMQSACGVHSSPRGPNAKARGRGLSKQWP